MSKADLEAIQEQLTLTLMACNNTSAFLNIRESNNDILVPEDPNNFAVVLEDVANKEDYTIMLEIIDSITSAIDTTDMDPDSPNTAILEHINHPLFTTPLREALSADLVGSEESLSDYLECMRMAVEDAVKNTEGYLSAPNSDIDMEVDPNPPISPHRI